MSRPIDIMEIRNQLRSGGLTTYIKNGIVYMSNDIGETISLMEVKRCTKISVDGGTYPRCAHCDRMSGLCNASERCL